MIPERTETDHEWIEFKILETTLKANRLGDLQRQMKSNRWKTIENKPNHSQGYNVVLINKKQVIRGKILAYAFLGIDPFDKSMLVFYKDDNRLNSSIENLDPQTRQTINFYRNSKGYYYDKWNKKYVPLITHNGESKKLTPCDNAEDAHHLYMKEKNRIITTIQKS